MIINPLDAHDRLLHFKNTQSLDISECCQDLVKQRPFGDHPFYIFAHPRTEDDSLDKRLIWMPWPVKPRPQTNSMLFKGYPGSDRIDVFWMIPPRELWSQYKYGNMLESSMVCRSVHLFDTDKESLCAPEPEDPTPEECQEILLEYQPQLFRRESLPEDKKAIWDRAMQQRKKCQT